MTSKPFMRSDPTDLWDRVKHAPGLLEDVPDTYTLTTDAMPRHISTAYVDAWTTDSLVLVEGATIVRSDPTLGSGGPGGVYPCATPPKPSWSVDALADLLMDRIEKDQAIHRDSLIDVICMVTGAQKEDIDGSR